jgi:hypothetical protein
MPLEPAGDRRRCPVQPNTSLPEPAFRGQYFLDVFTIRQQAVPSRHRLKSKDGTRYSKQTGDLEKRRSMAFYAVNLQNHATERVSQQYKVVSGKVLLIEAVSAKEAWSKASHQPEPLGCADCERCGHRYCRACEECSVTKRYSDYWICHNCGDLNRRAQALHLREVSNELGKN